MEGWWAASYVVLWLLVVVLCVVVVGLARQVGTLHLRLGPRGALEAEDEGPPLGTTLEPLETDDLAGRPVTIAAAGESQLLLFVSPGCPLCEQVMPAVPALAGEQLSTYVVSDADASGTVRMLAGRRMAAPVVAGPDISRSLDVPGTPYAVVLDEAGVVRAKGTVNNLEQVEGLVLTARHRILAPAEAA